MTVTADLLRREGYIEPRQLPDGRWIGVRRFFHTVALVVGLDETGYSYRYCYEAHRWPDAITDALEWNGEGDPPGMWIKQKGRMDRLNPRWLAEAKEEIHGK